MDRHSLKEPDPQCEVQSCSLANLMHSDTDLHGKMITASLIPAQARFKASLAFTSLIRRGIV